MKSAVFLMMALALIALTGCQPSLDTTPYGTVEKEWMRYVKKSYPSWEPPQTLPPGTAVRRNPELETLKELPSALPQKKEETIVIEEQTVIEEPVIEEPIVGAPAVEETVIEETKEPAPDTIAAPVMEPVEAAAPVEKIETYTVQKGDTLSGIAFKFYGKGHLWKRIADMNGISDPRKVRPGQTLKIPVNK